MDSGAGRSRRELEESHPVMDLTSPQVRWEPNYEGSQFEAAKSCDRVSPAFKGPTRGLQFPDFYRFFLIFRTFLGDFTLDGLDSRSL